MASLFVGACGRHDEPLGPTATLPQGTTTTNPYAVPVVIDEAYVNRVLAGLDHALGDVTRIVVSERAITQDVVDRLKALYIGDYLKLSVAAFEQGIRSGFTTYREPPGDRSTVVTRLISISSSCIFAEVRRDYSATSVNPAAATTIQWVAIQPSDLVGVAGSNPTRWVFISDGFAEGGTEPRDPCAES